MTEEITPINKLTRMVMDAADTLYRERNVPGVIAALEMAGVAYKQIKDTKAEAKKRGVGGSLMDRLDRVLADAVVIRAEAERRIADAYEVAQERGDVRKTSGNLPATPMSRHDFGLDSKELFYARTIRDAERKEPGFVRRVLDETIEEGLEPSMRRLQESARDATRPPRQKRATFALDSVKIAAQVRTLKNLWNSTRSITARRAFLGDFGILDEAAIEAMIQHSFGMRQMAAAKGTRKRLPPINKLPVLTNGEDHERP